MTTPQQPDLTYIRCEIDRLCKRLSVAQVTIANAETLKLVASCQPNDRFYLWQATRHGQSPVEDALNSLQELNNLLNPEGTPEIVTIPISVLDSPTKQLKACLNRLHTIKAFATVMMFAIAYQQEAALVGYGEVADYISDELGSVTLDIDDLLSSIGHRLFK